MIDVRFVIKTLETISHIFGNVITLIYFGEQLNTCQTEIVSQLTRLKRKTGSFNFKHYRFIRKTIYSYLQNELQDIGYLSQTTLKTFLNQYNLLKITQYNVILLTNLQKQKWNSCSSLEHTFMIVLMIFFYNSCNIDDLWR